LKLPENFNVNKNTLEKINLIKNKFKNYLGLENFHLLGGFDRQYLVSPKII